MTITAAVYCGGPLYSGGDAVIDDLKKSGFTEVVAWALHVESNGDLIYNNPKIVSDGKYIGDSNWPTQISALMADDSTVKRLLFSVGGWGVQDFPNIQSLIAEQGTGPDSILYKNFKILKETIPQINAIDLDDETLYDQDTTVAFCNMLHTLGYEVTFCPYTYESFWVNCLYELNSKTPGLVTAFNLQCYAGGAGNTPGTWIAAIQKKMGTGFDVQGFVVPGLWCRHGQGCQEGQCPDAIHQQLENWNTTGIEGGFIWLYDDIESCKSSDVCSGSMSSADYAHAIISAFPIRNTLWEKVDNVAEYKGASWNNFVKMVSNTTVASAKQLADEDENIHFFFYCNQPIVLNERSFNAGDAVFFSGQPWYGSAPQCDAYQKVIVSWDKKPNVAEYKGASWSNMVKQVSNTTVEEAKKIADSDPQIAFFFYCNQTVYLEPKGIFEQGDAVFFSGKPWYGSAPQCDAYEKTEIPVWE